MRGDIEKGYDRTSFEQSRATIDSINQNPVEQQILHFFAAKFRANPGLLCDLGCGPGQVARFFHDRGFETVGIDLSAGMLRHARELNPDIRFLKANMKKLPFADGELGAVVGFLSLCHVPRWEVPDVLAELKRALRPSGLLLLAFHLGSGTFFRTESWGKPVSLQTTLFQSLEIQDYMKTAGFKIDGMTEQTFQGPRGYVWAIKPDAEYDTIRSLRQAILSGSAKRVTALLEEGLSPDTAFDGFTGLHLAAGDGRRELIKLLLKAGASVDARCWGGGTPLYVAIQMGQLDAAKRLIGAGADPSLTDHEGNTLLHVAGRCGRIDVVQWLLKLRIDPQAKNSQGETPEILASRSGFNDVATMLRIAGEN